MPKMISAVLIFALLGGAVAGCGTSDQPGGEPAPPSSTASPAPSTSPPDPSVRPSKPGPSGTTAKPGQGGASTSRPSWSSGPVTVPHSPAVPPVPIVAGVRYAAHSDQGFDRIVFDISGALPGYRVRYVDRVTADPSDRPVSVPGRRHLLITLEPAQAHRDGGAATVSGVHRIGLPMLESYAVVGDFEGVVSIALGLDDVVGYRVGELPGRIYLDVAA